jgi:hypothetical protein
MATASAAAADTADSNISYVVVHIKNVNGQSKVMKTSLYTGGDVGYNDDYKEESRSMFRTDIVSDKCPAAHLINSVAASDPFVILRKGATPEVVKVFDNTYDTYNTIIQYMKQTTGSGDYYAKQIFVLDSLFNKSSSKPIGFIGAATAWMGSLLRSKTNDTKATSTSYIYDISDIMEYALAGDEDYDTKAKIATAALFCATKCLEAIKYIVGLKSDEIDSRGKVNTKYEDFLKKNHDIAPIGVKILNITLHLYETPNQYTEMKGDFDIIVDYLFHGQPAQAGGKSAYTRRHRHRGRSFRRTMKNIGM